MDRLIVFIRLIRCIELRTINLGQQEMVFNQLTLLFIRGAGSNPLIWHLQLKRFKEDTTAIQLLDHPTGSGCTSIEECAKAVERQIEENRIRKPIPVGHSMGGAIVIELALRKPKLEGSFSWELALDYGCAPTFCRKSEETMQKPVD